MSVFYNWSKAELAALSRATAKLRAQQTTEKPKPKPKTTGGYYDAILYRRMHNSSELQQRRSQ